MRQRDARETGQSTIQYALLIAVVVAGFLGVATYVNRGFQGRLRRAAEAIGPRYGPGLVQDSTEVTHLASRSRQSVALEGAGLSATSVVLSATDSTTTRDRTEALTDETGRDLFN